MQTPGQSESKAVNPVRFHVRNQAGLLVTVGLFTLLGLACGPVTPDSKVGAEHGKNKTVARCTNRKPIGARLLRDALRRHGFSAECQAIAGAQVANAPPTAQGAEEARADREGLVLCEVQKRPIGPRMARHRHQVFEYDSLPTHAYPGREVFLANIECSLYLDSSPREEAPRELRAAFDELSQSY